MKNDSEALRNKTWEQQLEAFPGRVLIKVLAKRMMRKLKLALGQRYNDISVVYYGDIAVFATPYLDGGGTSFGQDYIRCLLELGIKRCPRIYEFCSGPGYIGYSLLASGFCEGLTLSDINAEAVKMAKTTASSNGINHLVNVYLSDSLDQIPETERWDLAVGNPPFFLPGNDMQIPQKPEQIFKLPHKEFKNQSRVLCTFDPDWSIHKRFYSKVKKFMNPGGFVVMQECSKGADVSIFEPMIEKGGGRLITTHPSKSIYGIANSIYYVISRW